MLRGAGRTDNTLSQLGHNEEAIAIYDDVVGRFGAATELPLLEDVARALVNKGVTLTQLGRREEAIAVYDDVVRRFGDRMAAARKGR
jgi:tetratricopeptide (TPR) repeat protein